MTIRKLIVLLLVIIGISTLFFFLQHEVLAQTATAAATTTITPTGVTQLPQTGVIQYAAIFFAISVGIIFLAFIF